MSDFPVGIVDKCDKCQNLSTCEEQGFVNDEMSCEYFQYKPQPTTKGDFMEEKVKRWTNVAGKLAILKDEEKELREEIAAHILQDKIKGAKKGVIGPYTLTATAKLNTKVDRDALKVLWPDLSQEEKAAIKFDPKVVAAKYKLIDKKSILNQVLTNKPGMPGLELKGVKE